MLVVLANDYVPAMEDMLVRNLRAKLGDQVAIEIEKVSGIPRGANEVVVWKVKHLYPDRM